MPAHASAYAPRASKSDANGILLHTKKIINHHIKIRNLKKTIKYRKWYELQTYTIIAIWAGPFPARTYLTCR